MQSSSQIITTNKPISSFSQVRCPSCCPTNSVKALKGNLYHFTTLLCILFQNTAIMYFYVINRHMNSVMPGEEVYSPMQTKANKGKGAISCILYRHPLAVVYKCSTPDHSSRNGGLIPLHNFYPKVVYCVKLSKISSYVKWFGQRS